MPLVPNPDFSSMSYIAIRLLLFFPSCRYDNALHGSPNMSLYLRPEGSYGFATAFPDERAQVQRGDAGIWI